MKKKLLYATVFLCMMFMVFQTVQITTFAQQANVDIIVNGEKMSAEHTTVQCGEGIATYDEATQTLTLNNATITKYYGGTKTGIYTNTDLKIVLIGNNVIDARENTGLDKGIMNIKEEVDISGTGSLKIDVSGTGIQSPMSSISIKDCELTITTAVVGITAKNQVSISDAQKVIINSESPVQSNSETGVTFKNTEIELVSTVNNGIYSNTDVSIDHCSLKTHGKTQGIYARTGKVIINESKIDAIGRENYGIYAKTDANITNSTIKVESALPGIQCTDSTIVSSEIEATSTADSAIYSKASIKISDRTKIKAVGKLYGILAVDSLSISDSIVDAASSFESIGICSRKNIILNNSKLNAKGGTNAAAIATRTQRIANEEASLKMDVGNLVEINGGKLAFMEWFDFSSNNNIIQRSWTSYIDKDDTELTLSKGGMGNPLNEVHLATPYTITFDVNGETGSNFEEIVYHSDKVSVPTTTPTKNGFHFIGWQLDGKQFDFENTAITSNLTLTAIYSAHVPIEDDGDCTTPITCSICNEITTEAKSHDWIVKSTTDGHLYECQNAGCNAVKDQVAHIPGNDDGDCTTPITCSTCNAIITEAKAHDWILKNTKESHWYACQNAGCHAVKDQAAHIPGEDATIEHGQLCTVCAYELKAKLSKSDVIEDKTTGVTAEYVDGTQFDMNFTLLVTPIVPERLNELNTAIEKIEPKYTLAALYDVKLLMNGTVVQPNGKLKITIPITENMKSMSDFKVIYVDDHGIVTVIPSEIKNDAIVFITDHFSNYGVIGIEHGKVTPPTGDDNQIDLLATFMVSSFIMAFIMSKRRKAN